MVTPITTRANDESCLINLAHGAGEVLEETLYAEPLMGITYKGHLCSWHVNRWEGLL